VAQKMGKKLGLSHLLQRALPPKQGQNQGIMNPFKHLNEVEIDRIIEMAWEDRTPFEAIETQFGLSESQVIDLMRHEMHPRNWRKWRARVQGRKTKHQELRGDEVTRFKCNRQRRISMNGIAKRR
jgi:uncharacterized protein (TIGR03643 family)